MQILKPEGWLRPSGYSYGVAARGRTVFVAGTVGWNQDDAFETDDLVGQVQKALSNIVAVLAEAGAKPAHITRMTWYVVDCREYAARRPEIGAVYRAEIGDCYPAMTLVQVAALLEQGAKVEVEATAVIPD